MKKVTIRLIMIAFLAIGLSFTACNSNSNKTEKVDKQGKEYTSAYICPMHCEGSGSNEAGNCPICGMDYKKNKNHKMEESHEGHNHNTETTTAMYACPMHPEITGNDGDKCSKCGMNLTSIDGEDHEGHNH